MTDVVSEKKPGAPLNTPAPFPVVGIGASAGGLEAITELFACLPADTGMAFLVVQHIGPDHASLLTEIVSKKTKMPVTESIDGEVVAPDHVYIIPPNTSMTISGGKLALLPRNGLQGIPLPIDDLFRSLAENINSRAIGVLLSGGGTDGAFGIQAIKEDGGLTFAQDEASARFNSMPRAAIRLECVDFVLPPSGIAREVTRIAKHSFLAPPPDAETHAADARQMAHIFQVMKKTCNMDFTHYKSGTVQRRLTRRMALHSIQRLDDYGVFLEANPEEAHALCQDFLIRVTSFFRDPENFEGLSKFLLPRLVKEHARGVPLRIWVPGCASGEEVYSLAICLLEYMGDHSSATQIQFFGTDVSETALDLARAGSYPESIEKNVSAERLARFFVKTGNRYHIVKSIRDFCIFARHNVTRDPPFSRLDLISCRNLLIYLDPVLQKRVIPLFHYALNPEGVLMLGPSETISAFSELFTLTEDKKFRIYTKKPLPVRTQLEYMGGYIAQARPRRKEAAPGFPELPDPERQKREADRVALSRYAPAGVLCDEKLNILEFRGDTSPYLLQPSGSPSVNLRKLARPGLLVDIGEAIRLAREDTVPTRREGVRVETPQGLKLVSVEAIPMRGFSGADSCFLVSFQPSEKTGRPASAPGETVPATANADAEVVQLKRELGAAHDYIAAMIEDHDAVKSDLQASEEEMLSSNEEFQSANEELETAKEELQSSNEELTTTNEELRHRNTELRELNLKLQQTLDYAEAIIRTVRHPLLVLDVNLNVLRANPAFVETFKTNVAAGEDVSLYDLGSGQWNIPELRVFLDEFLLKGSAQMDYEITHTFTDMGEKTMRLNAAQLPWEDHPLILLAIEDTTDYTRAMDSLKANDRRKDEFLAMLAHELRNPLAPIQSALEILQLGGASEETEKESLEIIGRQLQKEVRLVDDLLDLSRITQGAIALRQEALDLAQVANQSVEGVRHHFDARGQTFSLQIPDSRIVVRGDSLRLEQVISNLLINASKYTQHGGRIKLTLVAHGGKAVLTVADNGIGIAPTLLPRIFDLFVQAELAIDRSQGGLGIGLTLVRRLVELQGGSVEAHSPGLKMGSEFIVRLPVLTGVEPVPTIPAEISLTPARARKILIVDDNADAAHTSALLLQLLGHEIRTATDGPTGLEAARDFKPEVILLDIGLPGLDGFEVARKLREMPETKKCLLIAVSGYGQPDDRRRSKEAGFDFHVVKPATLQKLKALIN